MLPTILDYDDYEKLEDQEKKALAKILSEFTCKVAAIVDRIDLEADKLRKKDFDEILIDRMTRDLKAEAFEEVVRLLDNVV